jgi:acid stress chaperone HdeB
MRTWLLLLVSAFFVFVRISALQAQVTLDVTKITCQQYMTDEIAPSKYVAMWFSGFYNGQRNNTNVDLSAMEKNADKVSQFCYNNRETTIMDAVKSVLGIGK